MLNDFMLFSLSYFSLMLFLGVICNFIKSYDFWITIVLFSLFSLTLYYETLNYLI